MDSIYVINYLINKQLGKKGGKMVALFLDLKAAFDSVDRGVLIDAMKESGVREELSKRMEEMLRETKIMVGGEMGESFWTAREVRQGYPLSSLLVNVLIADLEEAMGKVKWGGVKVGGERIYTLAYAT